jgi:hypothetical protein
LISEDQRDLKNSEVERTIQILRNSPNLKSNDSTIEIQLPFDLEVYQTTIRYQALGVRANQFVISLLRYANLAWFVITSDYKFGFNRGNHFSSFEILWNREEKI